jgi:hypothetical protein
MSEGKQKLTLSVDTRIVERAKELGINISELTEQVLRGYAFDPSDLDEKALRERYLAFYRTMDPLLSKYGASVVVGDMIATPEAKDKSFEGEVRYCGKWGFSTDFLEDCVELEHLESGDYSVGLRDPAHVLASFVEEIRQAKERRKEQVGNLLLAARIVEAISDADSGTTLPRAKGRQGAAAARPRSPSQKSPRPERSLAARSTNKPRSVK